MLVTPRKVVEKRWTRDHRLLMISLAGLTYLRMLSLILTDSFLDTKEFKDRYSPAICGARFYSVLAPTASGKHDVCPFFLLSIASASSAETR